MVAGRCDRASKEAPHSGRRQPARLARPVELPVKFGTTRHGVDIMTPFIDGGGWPVNLCRFHTLHTRPVLRSIACCMYAWQRYAGHRQHRRVDVYVLVLCSSSAPHPCVLLRLEPCRCILLQHASTMKILRETCGRMLLLQSTSGTKGAHSYPGSFAAARSAGRRPRLSATPAKSGQAAKSAAATCSCPCSSAAQHTTAALASGTKQSLLGHNSSQPDILVCRGPAERAGRRT